MVGLTNDQGKQRESEGVGPQGVAPVNESGYMTFSPPPSYTQTVGAGEGGEIYGRIMIGLVFVFIGLVISTIPRFFDTELAIDIVVTAAQVLSAIGAILIALSLVQGALVSRGFSDQVRLGMLIALGLMFTWVF